jgi:hypothetical protein
MSLSVPARRCPGTDCPDGAKFERIRAAEGSRRTVNIRPYYIAPDGKAGKDAFVIIRQVIEEVKMVAIGRVVLTSRGACHRPLGELARISLRWSRIGVLTAYRSPRG